ncbi:acyl-CoA dehydrogenase family protein [Cystobacter fuscus]
MTPNHTRTPVRLALSGDTSPSALVWEDTPMPRADITDLMRLDDLLSDEEKAARDTMARFVDTEVLPIIGQHFREGTFPAHLVPRRRSWACSAPTSRVWLRRDERRQPGPRPPGTGAGDSGLRSFASVQGSLCMFPIHSYGSEEQKQRFLPAMARGELIGCFGLTEADFGSNPAGMRTRACRDGDTWVLNGSKTWITNATIADVAVVWAKTDEGGAESVRGFLVEKGMPGFGSGRFRASSRCARPPRGSCPSRTCACPSATCCPG